MPQHDIPSCGFSAAAWDALVKRVQQLEKQMGSTTTTLSQQATQIQQLTSDLTAVQADFSTVTTGIAGLQSQITTLQATIQQLQNAAGGDNLSPATEAALTAAVTQADAAKASADQLAADFPAPATPSAKSST
jgi:chromosome segregation ATPase